MKKFLILLTLGLFLVLAACSMPSANQPTPASPDAAFTQAAQTVSAELTRIAQSASATPAVPTDPPQPTATFTPQPTNTPISSPTKTAIPCLMVGFNTATIDQTVPDNTVMAPGQSFVKTWRLINLGSCQWNSSYQLVFDHGDGMGVPSGFAQTLTSGTISYGQAVDVSVSLVAPNTSGTYTGYWRFRDPNGVYFGIGGTSAWIVKIKVVNATSLSLTPVPTLSGSMGPGVGPTVDFTVGEWSTDNTKMVEMFLDYDISTIPANATIAEVKFDLQDYTVNGKPFNLGVLNGYLADYGATLESADYVTGFPNGNIIDFGSTKVLDKIEVQTTLVSALQSKLGTPRFQLRLQFPGSNNDGVLDNLVLAHPTLLIKYTTP